MEIDMRDNANTIKVSYPEAFITVKEDKRGDWSEIAVYVDPVLPGAGKICTSIITHPCSGAKWFVHDRDTGVRGVPFKTKKLALWAAIEAAKDVEAYRHHTK
jgi:hypothetical protein